MTIPEYTCPNCGHEDPKVAADIKAAAVMAIEMTRRSITDPEIAAKAAERAEALTRAPKTASRRERRKR